MLRPGDQIASYTVERRLGAGGMGEVYLAFDGKLERRVALKVLPAALALDRSARLRMLREARAASALRHPGIVTIHDVDESEGQTYIVMEYVEGETFSELVARRGPLPPGEALELVARVADAIDAAHRAGVLHRDIKAANLMLDKGGVVKVLDFGLSKRTTAAPSSPSLEARARSADAEAPTEVSATDHRGDAPTAPDLPSGVDPAAATVAPTSRPGVPPSLAGTSTDELTEHGTRMGTAGWSALELLDGVAASERSDVFSLGVVLYFLLTGELPFGARAWADLHRQLLANAPTPVSMRTRGAVGPRLDAVLARALSPEPDLRWPTGAALVAAARAAIAPRRRRWLVPALAAGAIGVAAGASVLAGSRATIAKPPPPPPAPPGFATGLRTALGGCAYSPAFLDETTVVFDHTGGDAVDLYRLRRGGSPEQLTSAATWEWRANPGARPGEIVYVVTDNDTGVGSRLAALDLRTGEERTLARGSSPAIAAAGGAYYYVDNDGAQIRRVGPGGNEVVFDMPADATAQMLVGSHDGARLAIVGMTASTAPKLCVGEIATRHVECLDVSSPWNARPAFAPDGRSLYYANADGVRRRWLDGSGRDDVALPGVRAKGGVAVSPSGRTLVYSDCEPRGVLEDVSAAPPTPLGTDDMVAAPAVDAAGDVAYVRRGRELMLRRAGGSIEPVGDALKPGAVMSAPAFSPDGAQLAVTVNGPSPGLQVYRVGRTLPPTRLTDAAGDVDPLWIDDDELAFVRWDDQERPHVFRIGFDGAPARRALPDDRLLVGRGATGELLLATIDELRLYWWDPTTNAQRPGPPALAGDQRDVYHHALSPDGRWMVLQLGRNGHVLWRQRLDARGAATGPAEKVWLAPAGATLTESAITNDGRVIVAPIEWRGELFAAPAP